MTITWLFFFDFDSRSHYVVHVPYSLQQAERSWRAEQNREVCVDSSSELCLGKPRQIQLNFSIGDKAKNYQGYYESDGIPLSDRKTYQLKPLKEFQESADLFAVNWNKPIQAGLPVQFYVLQCM